MNANVGVALRSVWRRYASRSQLLCVHPRTTVLAATMAGITGLVGCAGTMPAPVGLTAAPGSSVVYNTGAAFSIGVTPTRAPPVRIGDELGFSLSSSETGYGHLYLLNASGGVLMLAENLTVTGSAQTTFPAPGSDFTLRASAPAGVERIIFLVTRQPFKGFGGGANSPIQLPATAREFILSLNTATGKLPGRGWALAEGRIEIVPKEG